VVADPRRGEIWWGGLPEAKPRPYLVLTRSEAIPVLSRIVVAPITRNARGIPTEVPLGTPEGLPTDCVASLDNVMTLGKALLVRRLGALAAERRAEPCDALRAVTDC
jgi:mRNA interferase MazF